MPYHNIPTEPINEILNETIEITQGLTFEKAIEVTTEPIFVIMVALVWFIPLLIYIIAGAIIEAKDSSGRKIGKKMIEKGNFWIAPIIWGLIQSALFLLIIYPVWLRIFA